MSKRKLHQETSIPESAESGSSPKRLKSDTSDTNVTAAAVSTDGSGTSGTNETAGAVSSDAKANAVASVDSSGASAAANEPDMEVRYFVTDKGESWLFNDDVATEAINELKQGKLEKCCKLFLLDTLFSRVEGQCTTEDMHFNFTNPAAMAELDLDEVDKRMVASLLPNLQSVLDELVADGLLDTIRAAKYVAMADVSATTEMSAITASDVNSAATAESDVSSAAAATAESALPSQ